MEHGSAAATLRRHTRQAIADHYVRHAYGGEPASAALKPERRTLAVKAVA